MNFLMQNEFFDYQVGPSVIGDYTFEKIPCSISLNIRGFIGDFKTDGKHHIGKGYSLLSYGTCFNYYLIKWDIEPYIGVGVFYNAHAVGSGSYLSNFSAEGIIGLKLSAKTKINFFIEVSQSYSKPTNEYEIYDPVTFQFTNKTGVKEYNFNSLFVRAGVLFRL